jgi:O-antigen/teichoic acid export membrane protein
MSTIKKLASQTVLYGLSSILPRVLNYLLVPLHTRVLINTDFGIMTKLYAYVAFMVVLLTYGMETAYFNFSRDENISEERVFSTGLIAHITTSILFFVVVLFFLPTLAQGMRIGSNTNYVVYFAAILVLDAVTALPFARLRKQNKALKFASIKLINVGVNITLNVLFLLVFPHYQILANVPAVAFIFIANLVASSVTLLMLLPQYKIVWLFDTPLFKKMIVYAAPLLVAGLAGMVNETIDRALMDTLLVGTDDYIGTQTGNYGACYKLAMLMSIFIQAYRFAAEPFFFNSTKDVDTRKNLAITTKYLYVICLLMFLGIIFNLQWIKYFVGEHYWGGLIIVPYLLLAYVFFAMYINLSMWFKLNNKTHYGALFAIAGAVITLVGNTFLIPRFGIIGAAFTTLICYALMFLGCLILGQKHYTLPFDWKAITLYTIITVITYSMYVLFNTGLLVNWLLLTVYISIVAYNERKLFIQQKI